MIYISKPKEMRGKWGMRSGGRKELDERNRSIKADFPHGCSAGDLADKYNLSMETIKKIVYKKAQ